MGLREVLGAFLMAGQAWRDTNEIQERHPEVDHVMRNVDQAPKGIVLRHDLTVAWNVRHVGPGSES